MRKIHICHITTVHKDGDVRIFHKMCCSLAKDASFEVSCIVPNVENRTVENVRIVSFETEIENRRKRISEAGKKALSMALKLKADIYHLHDPELLRIALKLKKKTNSVVVFDSHEDVPQQILDKYWIPCYQRRLISWAFSKYQRFVCARIDGVISVTPIICQKFMTYQKNVELVANFPDISELEDYEKSSFSRTICYVGGIFKTRGIIELVKAIEHIEVTLLLAGTFESEELETTVRSLPGWRKVEFYGQVGRNEIIKILKKSEIGIVTLHPTSSYVEAYPIKMFEYMAMKNAVLASDFPIWRSIVQGANCGELVDPLEVKEIAGKLKEMLDNPDKTRNMGANGAIAARDTYQWSREYEKLKAFYLRLSNQPK
jgi:glycosyltransferase involved in cell wall biosynthesis